jgi:hypothetical protein
MCRKVGHIFSRTEEDLVGLVYALTLSGGLLETRMDSGSISLVKNLKREETESVGRRRDVPHGKTDLPLKNSVVWYMSPVVCYMFRRNIFRKK